jgi:hypothetical protein
MTKENVRYKVENGAKVKSPEPVLKRSTGHLLCSIVLVIDLIDVDESTTRML